MDRRSTGPGSPRLTDGVAKAVPVTVFKLPSNHGVVSYGETRVHHRIPSGGCSSREQEIVHTDRCMRLMSRFLLEVSVLRYR